MIEQNLPALIVVVPLLAGLFCALSGRGMVAWVIAFTSTILSFAVAVKLLAEVHAYGVISYAMGNWTIPFGIEYRIDGLNALVLLLVSGIAVVVTFYARVSLQKEIPADRLHFFYAVWMLCITGLLGITVTGDAFNVYVLLEISSLTTYTLVAMGKGRDKRALTASINYLVLGTIGASFILLGIGYLYMATGTLNMADMAERLRGLEDNRTVITAFALLMVGFSVKMALFPLHAWLPNAYTYAPSAATALLAATATKVGVYTALRFLFTILGVEFSFRGAIPTGTIVMVFGSLAILFASYVAIRQTNIKRMLAYSSVAQIGYIALGFALANQAGLTGSLVHVFNHAIMKGGLFLALGAVAYSTNSTDIASMRGLGRKMPITMAAFVAGGFGLIG
ncbi:MAG: proton-conducting transporter membrane subunit, partial [Candidatus Poribacteria bacterium]|nr:proton-conducting transporter membrane subunit [Candidatus Poribacteria bacterium]